MDTNKMLEQFEAAFVTKYGFGRLMASANADARAMYEAAKWAWQASRESIVVELPSLQCLRVNEYDYQEALNQCRVAVEAQGLKVEVKP